MMPVKGMAVVVVVVVELVVLWTVLPLLVGMRVGGFQWVPPPLLPLLSWVLPPLSSLALLAVGTIAPVPAPTPFLTPPTWRQQLLLLPPPSTAVASAVATAVAVGGGVASVVPLTLCPFTGGAGVGVGVVAWIPPPPPCLLPPTPPRHPLLPLDCSRLGDLWGGEGACQPPLPPIA